MIKVYLKKRDCEQLSDYKLRQLRSKYKKMFEEDNLEYLIVSGEL